jgi:hypothetical protein
MMKNTHFFSQANIALGITFSLVIFAASTVQASEDTAIVESLTSDRHDLQEMDFLGNGRTFDLQEGEVLTLVYLNSCVQEVITGGTVTIGARKSEIIGGSIKTSAVKCDGDVMTASE